MKSTVIFLLLFVSVWLSGQEHFVFSPINSSKGLSDNRVRALSQLPDGRMIIITEALVNIYDGSTFRYMHFNNQKAYSLKNYSGWHHAYVDNRGHLWLKNQYKLMLFDIQKELFVPGIDSIFRTYGVATPITDFFMDSEHNFWLVSENNELLYRNNNEKKTIVFLSDISKAAPPNDHLYDIAILEKQLFLFYKSGLMICYDINSRKQLYIENPFNGKNRYSNTLMVVPYKNYLYQVRNGDTVGLFLRFNISNKKWEKILETDYWLNTLTIDNTGNCWVSSFKGLWMINGNLDKKQLISSLYLVDGKIFETEISTQYNDNQGGLWVGSINRGLLYYHPDRFKFKNFGRSFFRLNEAENLRISCFTEIDGDIFIGTQNGLYLYKKKSQTIERFRRIPENTMCNMLLKDSRQNIWLCSRNNGIFYINNKTVNQYKLPYNCQYLLETFEGSFYLCTNKGIGIFDPLTGKINYIDNSANNSLSDIYKIISLNQDTLIGISNAGLFLYNIRNKTFSFQEKKLNLKQYHSNHNYNDILVDSRGLLWFGTQDGLNVYDPHNKTSENFFQENGLINNTIWSILEDKSGKIWVSTSNGISCIDIKRNKESYSYKFVNFNSFDGVIENEFLPRSAYLTSDNRILWGGLDGFNEIDLKVTDFAKQYLSVPQFTKFFISGNEIKTGTIYNGNTILEQSINSTKEINLKYFQNFFSFEISALNYVNPAQTFYRYKLDGVDDTWNEINTKDGIGRISYTNVSPGSYKLLVFTANNNKKWGNRYAEIIINISPPWWKTPIAYVIYGLSFLSIMLSFLNWNRQRMKKKHQEELDQIKFSFFTNISHELRTPLTLIITPLGSLLKRTHEESIKTQLASIYRNANVLLNMVNQLIDFRKLEMNGESLQLTYCNIREYIETIIPSFQQLAFEKDIEFDFECTSNDIYANIDKDKFLKILNNLLSNAFKFTFKGGHISLKLSEVKTNHNAAEIIIQVADTGCGIPETDIPRIFDRFYQVKKANDIIGGSGIGLYLVKEYMQMHNGSVRVESTESKGSTFTLSIPSNLEQTNEYISESEKRKNKNSRKILIIEDNIEFRKFLYDELSARFQVNTACNGREGLNKAREEQPDLIITDIMMPEMTGTELCRILKNDLHISHIPVIILTAKTSEISQIEGFESGADAYITKPFNMEILLLRINHLIEQQEQRKILFRKSLTINPDSFTLTNIDEELIRKVVEHIEKNMGNNTYSVEQLSKDMFMDRTGLYRKLLGITGQTPTEFIRSVRLKMAIKLLQKGLPVSEVSDKVGFGTTSYFIKCFREEFGMKPLQYKISLHKKN